MATTTIRIEDELKMRVAVAAEIAGKTTQAFILGAISETVEQVELDAQFHAIAERGWADIVTTGKTVPWDAAKEHLGGPIAWTWALVTRRWCLPANDPLEPVATATSVTATQRDPMVKNARLRATQLHEWWNWSDAAFAGWQSTHRKLSNPVF